MMQDVPLTVQLVLRRMDSVTGDSTVAAVQANGQIETQTFRDVAHESRLIADGLITGGLGSGDRVASIAYNTAQHLALLLGVPAMGGVLHTVNPRLTDDQIRFTLSNSGARTVFIEAQLVERFSWITKLCPDVQEVMAIGPFSPDSMDARPHLASAPSLVALPELDENQAAIVCYTTGTTGTPKGVLYSHRSIMLHALSICLPDVMSISSKSKLLPIVPFYHANGWGLPHAAGLTGAGLILPGSDVSGPAIGRLVHAEGATVIAGVPTVLSPLVDFADKHPGALGSVELVVSGGSPLTAELVEGFARHGIEIVQGWGMTETSPCLTMSRPPKGAVQSGTDRRFRLSAGRLNPLVDVRVVSVEGAVLPWDGESTGEIEVRSPYAASGYFGVSANESAASFHDGWLRTGDIASIEEAGYVYLKDRLKDVIKSGGEWIPSLELEVHIRTHPAITDVAIVAAPDARWGERPVAFVVTRQTVGLAEVQKHLEDHDVPKWWWPKSVHLIDTLPITSVGKVDKKALRALAIEMPTA